MDFQCNPNVYICHFTLPRIVAVAYAKISRITFKHSHHQRVQVAQIHRNSTKSQLSAKMVPRKSFSVLVLGIVIFFFVLCWTFTIYRGICDSFSLCKVQLSVILASRIFLVGNTAVDPVVYAILKQDIRRELVRTLSSVTRRGVGVQSLHMSQTRTAVGQSQWVPFWSYLFTLVMLRLLINKTFS